MFKFVFTICVQTEKPAFSSLLFLTALFLTTLFLLIESYLQFKHLTAGALLSLKA